MNLVAKKKFEPEKPLLHKVAAGNSEHGKTPLAAAIARHLAETRPAKSASFHLAEKAPGEKERGAMIACWQCFYLNNVLIKCIYPEKEEVVHGE